MARPRIYLTGRVIIEHGEQRLDEHQLSGRQGRLAFVHLAAHPARTVCRGDLVSAIWGDQPPADTEGALNAILSKLRSALRRAGLSAPETTIDARSGTVALRLPADTWIDLEEASNAMDEAEGAWRCGDTAGAWALSNVAIAVARRPFLADLEAPWIEARRAALRAILVRALERLAEVSRMNGEPDLAIQYANEVLVLEPFREPAYQRLMRLHADAGNGAEAVRVFGRCRELLREELGTSPSPQTEAVFLEILRAGAGKPGSLARRPPSTP
ncbi:MAG: BTAD domain-containing putative transcriptional regulator [Vicinamibacterales bacterium]